MIHERDIRRQRPCYQEPVCVDDYGNAVFRGHYSGELVWPEEARYFGPIIPQAGACYVDGPGGAAARKASLVLFHESEANCNTCRFLVRLPFKRGATVMPGRCTNSRASFSAHPYPPDAQGVMRFAPDDWQGMPCWQARE